jgi:ABC-type glycerol-3-phosphate transport system permease component
MEAKTITWSKIKYHWEIYLFVLPTLFLIGLFLYYPASQGVYHSFFRWNGAEISEYVGWYNYLDLLQKSDFWVSFKVAFIVGLWNIAKMIPALLVAVCIHRCRSGKMQFFYRTMFVVPMVIPGLVVVLIWRSFFFEATSGYMNKFLYATGLFDLLCRMDRWFDWGGVFVPGQSPAWLGDPNLILPAAILWGFPWVGSFAVLTYLAKLQSIDKQIYEAAEIDGASWFAKFTKIEFPLITGSVYIMLVFTIIGTISDAGMVIALAGIEGGPGGKLTVPAVFMLRKAFVEQQMGYACAVGIILTLIILALQKVSNVVMDWEAMKEWHKKALKIAALLLGALLLYQKVVVPVGFALVLAALPYSFLSQAVWSPLVRALRRSDGLDAAPGGIPAARPRKYSELARESTLERTDSALGRVYGLVRDIVLRCCKHGFIWLVLTFAFLPVYLMIIVSIKDNQAFYAAPTSPNEVLMAAGLKGPDPQHPNIKPHLENWSKSWELVGPTVANSIFISTTGTVCTLVFAVMAAYFFARLRMPLSSLFWNAILILMMMPMIANLVPLFILLRGLGLLNTYSALILVATASGQMFAIFVLRSFVADIPQALYDAAEIDGANHFQQLKNIVLPLSGPILGTVGVMNFISVWNEFVLALIIMRDQGRLPVTVQLLRMAGEYIKLWGPLMAGYAIASIPIVVLFIFSMKLFIRGMTEGAVKG